MKSFFKYAAFLLVLFIGVKSYGQAQGAKTIIDIMDPLVEAKNWHEAKRKADEFYYNYPQNPTRIDSLERVAIDLYTEIINRRIYEEERLWSEIKRTENEYKCRDYLNEYPYGKYRDKVEAMLEDTQELDDWNEAKSINTSDSYDDYLDKYPNGEFKAEAIAAKERLDQNAYDYAKRLNTIYGFENYINKFPYGKYKSEAQDKIDELEEDEVYNTAKTSNQLEDYEAYITKYPYGRYATTVNSVLKSSYIFYGDDYFNKKDYSNAKYYYQKYISRYTYDAKASYARTQIEKCDRKTRVVNRPDRWYFSYHFDDSLGFFGFSTGTINQSSLGFYTSMRMNFGHRQVIYDYYPTSNFVEGIWDNDDITLNGEFVTGKFFSSVGFTYGIFNPMWIYGGVGMSITNYYVGIDKWYSDGSLYENDWARVKEINGYAPHVEAGLQMDLWGLNLRYGLSYSTMYGMRNTFGIGISGIRY
ncbi:MAG: hypothetical protein JXQ87_17460 [Bacteroidia bacterium]